MPLAPQYDPLQTFLGIANKQTDQNNKLQQLQQEGQVNQQTNSAKNAGEMQNLQQFLQMRKNNQLPQDANVSVGGASLKMPDEEAKALKHQAMNDREAKQIGTETGNLQNDFSKNASKAIANLQESKTAKNLFDMGTPGALGAATIAHVRSIVPSRITNIEIQKANPMSVLTQLEGKLAMLKPNDALNTKILNPADMKAISDVLNVEQKENINQIRSAHRQVVGSAHNRATLSAQKGVLDQTLGSLKNYAEQSSGISMDEPQPQPSQMSSQDIMKRIQQLEAKKAAAGGQ